MFKRCLLGWVLVLSVAAWAKADFASDYKAALELSRKGQHAEALAAFQKLAAEAGAESQKTDALDQASQSATKLQKYDEALALAKQIPAPTAALNAEARVYAAQRAWAKVVEAYAGQDLEKWPPRDAPTAAMQLGAGYWGLRKGEEAARYYAIAAKTVPEARTKADMYNRLGDVYRTLLQEPDKAVEAYTQVYPITDNQTKYVFAAVGIALVRQQQKKLDEALAELDKVNLLKVSNTYARVELLRTRAALLAEQGHKDKALATYREALDHPDINPSHKKEIDEAIAKLQAP